MEAIKARQQLITRKKILALNKLSSYRTRKLKRLDTLQGNI